MFGEVLRASEKKLMGAHRLSLGVRIFMLVTPRVPRGAHTYIFFYSRHGLRQKEGLLIVYFYSRVNDKTARHTAPPTQKYVYFYFPTSSNVLVKFGLLHRRWKREKIRKSTTLVEKPKSR